MARESALHQAVIANDLAAVLELSKNQNAKNTPNSLGFTPLEIAQYLGSKEAAAILNPSPNQRPLHVVFPNIQSKTKYSIEDFRSLLGIHYLPHLLFKNYAEFKRVIRNCPLILKSRLNWENRALELKYHKQLQQGEVAPLEIRWIDDEIGFGVFAYEDIPAEAYIGEYTGLVRQLNRLHPDHNAYCFQYPTRFWSWNYMIIDALRAGNELRFINHSDIPNLKPACLLDRGLLHLVFLANRDLKKGEQLTIDYGSDYWRKREKRENL